MGLYLVCCVNIISENIHYGSVDFFVFLFLKTIFYFIFKDINFIVKDKYLKDPKRMKTKKKEKIHNLKNVEKGKNISLFLWKREEEK